MAEWCDPPAPGADPVVKGESWDQTLRGKGAGWSEPRAADTRSDALGFRLVRVPAPARP